MILKFLKLFLMISMFTSSASAAPWPMTGSSAYLNNKKNYFLHPFKIGLNLENTPYSVDLTRNDEDKWTISRVDSSHLITLRMKRFRSDLDYEKSLKGWIKEYQKSGFQLLNQQMGERRPEQGWLHLQDSKGQHMLQYFRYQNKTWVYFNCIGKKDQLSALHKACEELSSRVQFQPL